MKTKITMFIASVFMIAGCGLIKDAAEVTIGTDLSVDIPVIVAGAKSADLTAAVNAIDFSVSQDLMLANNSDIEAYLDKIREVNLNSLVVTVTGLSTGQTINSISLGVTGVGNICTQTNITATNNTFTPVIDQAKLDQVGTKLKNDLRITVTVSGNVSGPMTFNVNAVFDADIVAGALD